MHSSIKSFYLQDGQQQLEKVDPHEYCLLATSALWGILSGIMCEYTDHMFAVGEPRKITTIYSHHNISWTKFFVLRFMAQVLNMQALNPREKQGSVTIMADRENDIGKIFTTSLLGTKTNFCMWKAI